MKNLTIGQIIEVLPFISSQHSKNSKEYKTFETITDYVVKNSNLKEKKNAIIDLGGEIGTIDFPYQEFGAINSLDLFGLDELIIFSYYQINKNKYKNTFDIGANIGIHSLVMNLCNWNVTSIEPDPIHIEILKNNLKINDSNRVNVVEAAVSNVSGELEFVRVEGNTTSSHLAGSKIPYGKLTKFKVKVIPIKEIMSKADFIKMDVEGNEKNIILDTEIADWDNTDMILEIGSEENKIAIYQHLNKIGVNAFSQKTNWKKVEKLEDMPSGYKEGSLFISTEEKMNWQNS